MANARTNTGNEQTILLNSILEELRAQRERANDADGQERTRSQREERKSKRQSTIKDALKKNKIPSAIGKAIKKGPVGQVGTALGGLGTGGVALATATAATMQFIDGFNNLAKETFGEDASTQEKFSVGIAKLSSGVANMLGFNPDTGEIAKDINDAFTETREDIESFTTGIKDAFKNFEDGKYIDSLTATVNEGTANLFSGVVRGLKNAAKASPTFAKAGEVVSSGVSAVKNFGGKMFDGIKSVASSGMDKLKGAGSKLISFPTRVVEGSTKLASKIIGVLGKGASKALPFIGPLYEGYEAATEEYKSSKSIGKSLTEGVGAAIGAGAGGFGGAAIGGLLGSLIFPGVGTAIGATIGSVVGQNYGGDAGVAVGEYLSGNESVQSAINAVDSGIDTAGQAYSDVKAAGTNMISDVNSQIDLRSQQLGESLDYAGYKIKRSAEESLQYIQQFNSSNTNTTIGSTMKTNPGFTNTLDGYVGGA